MALAVDVLVLFRIRGDRVLAVDENEDSVVDDSSSGMNRVASLLSLRMMSSHEGCRDAKNCEENLRRKPTTMSYRKSTTPVSLSDDRR
jgi:hypothetical protein